MQRHSVAAGVEALTRFGRMCSTSCVDHLSKFGFGFGQATTTQVRGIQFDIEDNSQVEFAMKKMNRKLNMEGILLEARIRERHTKKSDQKIIDQRSTAKRLARKAMGRRIRWIMKKRERGY